MKTKYKDIQSKSVKLEQDVIQALKNEILNSNQFSKHISNEKAIKVSIFDYQELINLNGDLTFLDEDGLHYYLFNECTINDLIDILAEID